MEGIGTRASSRFYEHKPANIDNRAFFGAIALIILPGLIFIVFVGNLISEKISQLLLPIFVYIFLSSLAFLGLTHFVDPGVIPPHIEDDGELVEYEDDNGNVFFERKRDPYHDITPPPRIIIINGNEIKINWCTTCKIYRPPRCSHCSECGVCVENFDHHCPWVSNCVGKRNYRFFLLFVSTTTALCLYTFCASFGLLYVLSKESIETAMPDYVADAIMKSPASFFLMMYAFIVFWSVGGLIGFHIFLMFKGKSTHEEIMRRVNPSYRNPWSYCLSIMCPPSIPSYVTSASNPSCI